MYLIPEQIIPFLYYVYITAITPGPANICSLGTAIHTQNTLNLSNHYFIFL